MLLILRPLPNKAAFHRSPSSAGASLEEDTRRERSSAGGNVDRAAGGLKHALWFFIAKVVGK